MARLHRLVHNADQLLAEGVEVDLLAQPSAEGLDALSAELVAVVRRTVQPSQTTLWLRPTEGERTVGDR